MTAPGEPNLRDVMIVTDVALAARTLNSHPKSSVMKEYCAGISIGTSLTVRWVGSEAKQIMAACEARGFNFEPRRQFGHLYAIVRSDPPDPETFNWDEDQSITRAIAFSRWVHDSPFGFEYAGRLQRDQSGVIAMVIPHRSRRKAYCSDTGRTWLEPNEWMEVAELLSHWPRSVAKNCPRINRASWYREHAAREYFLDVRWVQLITALEALVSIWNGKNSRGKQFRSGVDKLAKDCEVPIEASDIDQAWKRRSEFVHAAGLPATDADTNSPVLDPLYLKVQKVLDAALIRCVTEDDYARHFATDDSLRAWQESGPAAG